MLHSFYPPDKDFAIIQVRASSYQLEHGDSTIVTGSTAITETGLSTLNINSTKAKWPTFVSDVFRPEASQSPRIRDLKILQATAVL